MMRDQDGVVLYALDELPASVQNEIVEKLRERYGDMDSDELTEDMQQWLEYKYGFRGCKIHYSLGYSQGDGACFEMRITSADVKQFRGVVRDWPRLERLLERSSIVLNLKHSSTDHYCHWNTVSVEYEFQDDAHRFHEGYVTEQAKAVEERCKEICQELEKYGYDVIEGRRSDESIREAIDAHDLLFELDMETMEWQERDMEKSFREVPAAEKSALLKDLVAVVSGVSGGRER